MAFRKVVNLSTAADETDLNQYADAFNGTPGGGQPMDLIDLAADRYYVVVKNGHANGKTLQLLSAAGAVQFQVDSDAVKASHDGGDTAASAVITESGSQHLQNKQITLNHRLTHFKGVDRAGVDNAAIPDVSSADVFVVTGSSITLLGPAVTATGHEIILVFSGQFVKIVPSALMLLHKTYISNTNSWLRLLCIGASWVEVGRGGDLPLGCKMSRNADTGNMAAITLASGAISGGGTEILWDNELWDYGGDEGMFTPTSAPTIPLAGKWRVSVAAAVEFGTSGAIGWYLQQSGSIIQQGAWDYGDETENYDRSFGFSSVFNLAAGATLRFFVGQIGAITKVVKGGATRTNMTLEYVSA